MWIYRKNKLNISTLILKGFIYSERYPINVFSDGKTMFKVW